MTSGAPCSDCLTLKRLDTLHDDLMASVSKPEFVSGRVCTIVPCRRGPAGAGWTTAHMQRLSEQEVTSQG